jgi:TRAP-type C4-dicarboxylate transport system permease small subunit
MTRVVTAAARLLSHVAAIALIGMVAVNVIDVGLRSGLNQPIYGTYELVELLLAAAAFFVIAEAFLTDSHITIELIDQVVPPRAVDVLRACGMAATVVFLVLLSWFMIQPAVDMVAFDEVTFDLRMPKILGGALVLIGIAAAAVAAFAIFVRDLRTALNGGPRP